MVKELKHIVCQKIRSLRIKNGLTQQDLAYTAGIDYKYLQKIESKSPPNISLQVIEKLSKALKISPEKLFKK